jgi:multidrug efflux pump
MLLIASIGSCSLSGSEANQPFAFRAMTARMLFNGTSSAQVDLHIAQKLEQLGEVPEVEKLRIYSERSKATLILQAKDTVAAKDVPAVWSAAQAKMKDARSSLPSPMHGPYFNNDASEIFGVLYVLESDAHSPAEMRQYAERTREVLSQVKNVAKVDLYSPQSENDGLYFSVSAARLSEFGLKPFDVLASIGGRDSVQEMTVLRTPNADLQARVRGKFQNEQELGALKVWHNNKHLTLGEIATIGRGPLQPEQRAPGSKAREAVLLNVNMQHCADTSELQAALSAQRDRLTAGLPAGVKLAQMDQSRSLEGYFREQMMHWMSKWVWCSETLK